MSRRPDATGSIRQQVLALAAEGLTTKEIATRVGVSRQRVSQIVPGHQASWRRSRERRQEIAARLATGESIHTLAAEYGLARNYVRAIGQQAGVIVKHSRPSKSKRDRIVARARAGHRMMRIAQDEGVAYNTVRAVVENAGVPRPQQYEQFVSRRTPV